VIRIAEQTYRFDNIQELYQTADQLPEADRHGVYAHHEERDAWEQLGWRNSLWLDGYGAVGDVSASEDYYNVIQYGDILASVGDAVEQYDGAIDVEGYVTLSASGHQMSSRVDFYGDTTIEPVEGDEINLGLQVRSGHSGYHGVKYDIGAERLVCSNGMVAFVDEMQFEQTHQDPLNPGLAQQAVDAVVEGTDEVEERLQRAREETFRDVDEAMLVLYDFGLDQYFDEPRDVFRDALRAEVADAAEPTLYDTYNAATRAVTHYTDEDMPAYVRDDALEAAGDLLDYPGYGLPEAEYLGQRAVDNRINERVEADEDLEPVIAADGEAERERLSELRAAYNDG
jgi:hypothetical protein